MVGYLDFLIAQTAQQLKQMRIIHQAEIDGSNISEVQKKKISIGTKICVTRTKIEKVSLGTSWYLTVTHLKV